MLGLNSFKENLTSYQTVSFSCLYYLRSDEPVPRFAQMDFSAEITTH